jgi:anti-anti-sigma regulatory factor
LKDFSVEIIKDIAVVKTNLFRATQIDAKPFWEQLEKENVFYFKNIIIDLSSCTDVDTIFRGMIVKVYRTITAKGNSLKLVLPQRKALDSFEYSGLNRVIESYRELETAINSYCEKAFNNMIDLYHIKRNLEPKTV